MSRVGRLGVGGIGERLRTRLGFVAAASDPTPRGISSAASPSVRARVGEVGQGLLLSGGRREAEGGGARRRGRRRRRRELKDARNGSLLAKQFLLLLLRHLF